MQNSNINRSSLDQYSRDIVFMKNGSPFKANDESNRGTKIQHIIENPIASNNINIIVENNSYKDDQKGNLSYLQKQKNAILEKMNGLSSSVLE